MKKMELRVLQYFLAVTKAKSISGAARLLHLSQPTLSRQLQELEQELGKTLFIRSNRNITLTEEGLILRKRAEEIIELMQKTQNEITASDTNISGEIYMGAGESQCVRPLIQAIQNLRKKYPQIRLHIISGDKTAVLEDLEHGLIDFALLFGEIDATRYDCLTLPSVDCFGVMMRKDDPLAQKEVIQPEDLYGQPLIVSRQFFYDHKLAELFGCEQSQIHIVGTYTLLFNGSLMVEEGIGYAICFDHIINITGESQLCFRPLSLEIRPKTSFVWKKNQVFSKAAKHFLLAVQNMQQASYSSIDAAWNNETSSQK